MAESVPARFAVGDIVRATDGEFAFRKGEILDVLSGQRGETAAVVRFEKFGIRLVFLDILVVAGKPGAR